MTAQEMFEQLGYTALTKKYTEGKLKTIEYKNEENKDWIKFHTENGRFIEINGNGVFIGELQAINQQCKELGWLDE